ncbi:MAG: hypothetical protein IE934_04685 [Sphingopyxis sp.]|nr:hypothetical protein [Sphingopyxis sp.]
MKDDAERHRHARLEDQPLWIKVVAMLQHNWAVIDAFAGRATVRFIDDSGFIFDELTFESDVVARMALGRNGFAEFSDDRKAQEFIMPPRKPYRAEAFRKRPIYSSGQFWH